VAQAVRHVQRLVDAGRSVMLQPYLAEVDAWGETAVLYLGGSFSHAIRKGPLLHRGSGLVAGLFAPEDIRPREAEPAERAVAAAACAAIPFDAPAYARMLELELTEPSLFLTHAPGAADRFARHLVQRLAPVGA
jgi:hypothetical protein